MPEFSSAWNMFYESYFGDPYMAWHDGLDEQALLSLTGEERDEAERLLLAAAASGSTDYRVAAGLRSLRSHKALDLLKQRLESAQGRDRVETALGLWQMEEYAPAIAAIASVLHSAAFWGDRLDAARALAHVPTQDSVNALLEALHDPQDLVRYHAAASLLKMHGEYRPDGLDTDPLAIELMSDDEAERKTALETLHERIRGKQLVQG
jgi:hypothetical protein